MKILSADFVLPIASDPIPMGAVAIDGARIIDVGPKEEIAARYADAELENLGNAAILPGFVNCHSHLELTSMRGYLDSVEHDFRTWLLTLNKRRVETIESGLIGAAALAGAVEGIRGGVTCFGDIGRHGMAGLNALKTAGLRGVLFQETEFSPDDRTADSDFETLKRTFLTMSEGATELVEVGISPHAPYTVSRKLFEKIAEFAAEQKIRISIHAAESGDEARLMEQGEGFFVEVYRKFGFEWKSPLQSSIEFLSDTGILETSPLLAHCVTVGERDIGIIHHSGAGIAHCPKSNAKFGHGATPFEKFLSAGIATGLASDSVASNNVCDMLEEARFAAFTARNRPDRAHFLTARDVLEAATIGGARAMGLGDKIGTLEKGKCADIAVVSLSNIAQQPVTDIYASLVFSSGARDVIRTIVNGKTIYSNGKCTEVDESALAEQIRNINNPPVA